MSLNLRVASTPTSWGVSYASDPLQPPWQQFLDEVAEAGYRWIESGGYGYLPPQPNRLGPELKSRGLSICGGRVMRHYLFDSEQASIREECFRLAELLSAAGAEAIILIEGLFRERDTGRLIDEPELGDARFKLLVERVVSLAQALRADFPLKTYFHPHAETHIATEEQMERFFDLAGDPELGQVLDTGHHAYCGGDPNSYMLRNHARIPYVHLEKHPPRSTRALPGRGESASCPACARAYFASPNTDSSTCAISSACLPKSALTVRRGRAGPISGARFFLPRPDRHPHPQLAGRERFRLDPSGPVLPVVAL